MVQRPVEAEPATLVSSWHFETANLSTLANQIGEREPRDGMSRGVKVDWHLGVTTLLHTLSNGKAPKPCMLGDATGFFFHHTDKKYLITNRHVVINEEEQYFPDNLVLSIHSNKEIPYELRQEMLPLYDTNGVSTWFEHPDHTPDDRPFDLVIFEIGQLVKESDMMLALSEDQLIPKDTKIPVGEDIFVIGYPQGFIEPRHNLPILRSGTLATTYYLQFDRKPICLIDSNLHQGDSGSPVFVKQSAFPLDLEKAREGKTYPYYLLGVHSGEYSKNGVMLGLHAVWYGRQILDIISKGKHVVIK